MFNPNQSDNKTIINFLFFHNIMEKGERVPSVRNFAHYQPKGCSAQSAARFSPTPSPKGAALKNPSQFAEISSGKTGGSP